MLHAKETHRDCDMVRELRSLFTGTPVCTVDQVHRTKHDACAEDTRRAMYGITEALGFTSYGLENCSSHTLPTPDPCIFIPPQGLTEPPPLLPNLCITSSNATP